MNTPLVSILMPAYNVENYVGGAIECILRQTYSNFELLICNDCSTDGTKRTLASFSDNRIILFENETNLGYLATWNKLISSCKGEFITFLDADDLCTENRIELLLNQLINNPEIDAIGSNFQGISNTGEFSTISNFHLEHEKIKDAMPAAFHFIGSALMIRRRVYAEIGGYHPFFNRMGAEDLYWIYLISEKFQLINLPDTLYYYRFNPNSVSGNLSNNPSKLNVLKVVEHLIHQRRTTGSDDLETGNIQNVTELLNHLNQPFIKDPSFYFYTVAKQRYYEGHKQLALTNLMKAIRRAPFNLSYYRDFFYFLRK